MGTLSLGVLVGLGVLLWIFPGVGAALHPQETVLLRSLGLKARPSPRSPAPVPPWLWKMFQKRSEAPKESRNPCWVEEFQVPGNVIRIFPDQGHLIHREEPQSWICLQKRLYFNFSALEEGEELTLAQLEIQFSHNQYQGSSSVHPFQLSLYRAPQVTLRGMSAHTYSRQLLVEQSFAHLHKSFAFNLTKVAKEWQTPSKNLGLFLEISLPASHESSLCSKLDSMLSTSLLVVSLTPGQCKSPRRRRSAYYMPVSASNICKPRRLYISFTEVGWENWIIAPQGYLANYCLGECPFPLTEELNSTNHAILQTIVHSLDPAGTPQPCCVPVRLSPISVLYYDNNDNVVLRHYEDMVVDECGCR
ncbi:embryonic growth/differentiation factor 1 [Notechis scutatus]|uniref:Embryonic growth/differentiation factor 1 n=1 Tax=Notechis scutatus TaxID=8663 RepID=A0A6J1VS00_9SAUR|nr:embryonic growth/differentiation factor 1 [Notechis scutatus]